MAEPNTSNSRRDRLTELTHSRKVERQNMLKQTMIVPYPKTDFVMREDKTSKTRLDPYDIQKLFNEKQKNFCMLKKSMETLFNTIIVACLECRYKLPKSTFLYYTFCSQKYCIHG